MMTLSISLLGYAAGGVGRSSAWLAFSGGSQPGSSTRHGLRAPRERRSFGWPGDRQGRRRDRMGAVKVRIGIALGGAGGATGFGRAVDRLEASGIDSLWLPEMVFGPLMEPFVGMTYALARTARLKVGTGVAVLPGRHPVLVSSYPRSPGWRRAGCCLSSA